MNWGTSYRVAHQWKALKPDVIHLNKQNLEDGLDLLRAAGQCGVPSVCTIHLTQTARYLRAKTPRLRDWIAFKALRKYRGVIVTVQEARRAALTDLVGGHIQTKTIFNGVPPVDCAKLGNLRAVKRKELGLKEGDFLVLGLGRMVAQKRPLLFLKVAEELHRNFPATRFLWIGDGNLASQWDDWVARGKLRGVISRVHWQAETLPFLLAGNLLLHVAAYEGLPFAIIEAMAAGLPCAITRNFASEIPLFDDRSVLFFDDPVTFAATLRDSTTLEAVAAEARRLIGTALSHDAMVESYERLYRETAYN
jgi:glycosyltransferase involved in cell wall biosynthesis